MNWSDGLTPDRLAVVEARNRRMIFTPPSATESMEHAQLALAHRAWVDHMKAGDESHREAWAGYAEQIAEQNARTEAARQKALNEKAQAQAAADEEQEERRNRQAAAILALSGDASAAIQAIRGEIAAILEG